MTREEYEAKAEAEWKKKNGIIDEETVAAAIQSLPCADEFFDQATLDKIRSIGR